MADDAYRRNSDRVSIKWRDIALGLLSIILTIVGYLYVDLNARVGMLNEKKLDKEEFYRISAEMNKKLDQIIEMHLSNKAR